MMTPTESTRSFGPTAWPFFQSVRIGTCDPRQHIRSVQRRSIIVERFTSGPHTQDPPTTGGPHIFSGSINQYDDEDFIKRWWPVAESRTLAPYRTQTIRWVLSPCRALFRHNWSITQHPPSDSVIGSRASVRPMATRRTGYTAIINSVILPLESLSPVTRSSKGFKDRKPLNAFFSLEDGNRIASQRNDY